MVITLQSRLSKIDIKGGVDIIYRSHVFTHVKNFSSLNLDAAVKERLRMRIEKYLPSRVLLTFTLDNTKTTNQASTDHFAAVSISFSPAD